MLLGPGAFKKKMPLSYGLGMNKYEAPHFIEFANKKGIEMKYNAKNQKYTSDCIDYSQAMKCWPQTYLRKKVNNKLFMQDKIYLEYSPQRVKEQMRIYFEPARMDSKGNRISACT